MDTAWCLAGAALLVLYAFWFFAGARQARWSPRGGPAVVSQAAMIVFYALAGVLQWRAGHNAQLDAATRRAWLTMTLANVGVIALSGTWFVHAWHGTSGTPSDQIDIVSTVIYALTNAIGILAVVRFPSAPRLPADRATFWLDAGAVLSAGLLLAWHLLFRTAIVASGGGGARLIGALVYPAADVLLVFTSVALLLRRPLPSSAAALRVFTFAIAVSTVADIPMVFDSLSGGSRGGSLSDLLYIFVAWLFGVAAYIQIRRAHADALASHNVSVGPGPKYSLLPYAAVVVVYAVLAKEAYRVATQSVAAGGAGYSLLTLVIGAAVVTGFVVARQVVVLRRNAELMADRLAREAYFRALVSHSSDPIIVLHADGTVREASPAVGYVLGHPWEALGGHPIADLLEADNVSTARADLLSVVAGATETNGAAAVHEWRFRHADGRPRWIEVRCTNLLEDAAVRGIVINGRDITERRMLEEQLVQHARDLAEKNARLQQSNAELEQFASVASHDLQEPLRKIQAFSDRMATEYADTVDERGRDYLSRMSAAAQRMQRLVEALLSLSRVTMKGTFVESIDLGALAKEVLGDLEFRIQSTKGRVELSELPRIDGDPVQIRQVFQNLIGNALKFHMVGQPPVVKVSAVRLDAATVELWFEDNGIGFESKDADRVFLPFHRLHGRTEYEGTGIGLTICQKITQRHGGGIRAESSPGHGSRFVVTLPIHARTGKRHAA